MHIVLTYTVVCVSKTRLPFRCHGARHAEWERGRHVVNVMPGPVLFRRAPVACCLRIFGALCESLEVIYCDSLSLRRLIDFVFRCCLYIISCLIRCSALCLLRHFHNAVCMCFLRTCNPINWILRVQKLEKYELILCWP